MMELELYKFYMLMDYEVELLELRGRERGRGEYFRVIKVNYCSI